MINLIDKKILFFCPNFLGYDSIIAGELIKKGAKVELYNERPSSNPLIKAIIRVNPKLLNKMSHRYFLSILHKESKEEFDYVFIIKGEAMSTEIIAKMKEIFPEAIFIYYSWDSIRNLKHMDRKIQYFHKAFSFDREDCKTIANVDYLPLFFSKKESSNENLPSTKDSKYNLSFIASLHSDRYKVLKKILIEIKNKRPDTKIYLFLYYSSKFIFFLKKILDTNFFRVPYKMINWTPLSQQAVFDKLSETEIVIDINHPNQSGLTMRTIEALVLKKKLITTNTNIRYEDFYSPENFLIVDRTRPVIPVEFLSTPYQEIERSIINSYSLESWLKKIFDSQEALYPFKERI